MMALSTASWQIPSRQRLMSDFELVDMGEIDEEEHKYLIVDKDSGDVYDIRNVEHL